MAPKTTLSRREFVKDSGGLLIGFSLADSAIVPRLLAAASPESVATPSPSRLDAWLRIGKDGMVHVFTGKPEIGMGVETGYRSEEHTSELQSHLNLVCRLLLEKKKKSQRL